MCDPAPWLHLAAGASSGNLETHFTIPIQGDVIHRVDVVLGVPPSWPPAQPLLPNSHQPMQNWADGGTTKIKVNPKNPGLRAENHPVYKLFAALEYVSVEKRSLISNLGLAVGLTVGGAVEPWILKALGDWKIFHIILFAQAAVVVITPL